MATTDTQAPAAGKVEDPAAPAPISGQVVAAYESMLASVPDAGEQGFERILEAIAAAQDVTQLDAPWRSSGLEELDGVPLTVHGIAKMPSDFPGGLPWFLVVDATIEPTERRVSITTGAVSVVAQLVRAWSLGAFPLRVRAKVAERPSKSGYYPVHLELIG